MGGPGELEVELKLLLSDVEALERIERVLVARGAGHGSPLRQVNHIFDTPAASLRSRRISLRVREEEGRFELTAKGPGSVEGDVHRRVELELELEEGEARTLLAGQGDALANLEQRFGREHDLLRGAREALAGERPVEVGQFENERRKLGPLELEGSALFFELDRTRLPGGCVDHELELEFPAGLEHAARELVAGVLREAEAKGAPAESKTTRFFAQLSTRGKG